MTNFERRALAAILLVGAVGVSLAENIDPGASGRQYAWGENIGWLNAEPQGDGGSGIEVDDTQLTGWIWAENAGWISLSCQNTGSCGTTAYGVVNDGEGRLSGFAWSENLGWINFRSTGSDCCSAHPTAGCTDAVCEATICGADAFCCTNHWDATCVGSALVDPQCSTSCGSAPFGVSIDPFTGDFSGFAWSENTGFINFGAVKAPQGWAGLTGWTCDPDLDGVCSVNDTCPIVANPGQGAVTFGQAVTASDPLNFAWATAIDFRVASGSFTDASDIGSYVTDFVVSGSGAGFNDATPPAASGYWYLFRVDCPAGSYASGGSNEAVRDGNVAP